MSDTVTLAGMAKEVYPISDIQKLEAISTDLLKELKTATDLDFSAVDGGSFKFAVKANGPHGQKMMNEKENLATATSSRVVQGKSYVKEYAGVLEFTKRELELAKKNDVKSFAAAKTFEMGGLIENAHKYFNRQAANGDGFGHITLVNGALTGLTTSVVVDDATPFQIGMVIDIWDAAGTTKQTAAATVMDIEFIASQTIVLDVSPTCDNDAIICIAGVMDNAAADGKEMIGLPLVFDDGSTAATFQGIVRTGALEVPNYRGVSLAVNAPISVDAVNKGFSRAKRITDIDFEKRSDAFWCMSSEQWRSYCSLSVAQVQFSPTDSPDLNNRNATRMLCGKRVVLDNDVSRTSMYLLTPDVMERAIATPLDWESDLGGTSLKWLSGTNMGVMVLYSLQQNFSRNPRAGFELSDITAVNI